VAGTDRRPCLLLALAGTFVQGVLRLLGLGQRGAGPLFGPTQAHAALPPRVEMIALVQQRFLTLRLPLRVHQGDPFRQSGAAIAR
jgi:hypothetical protein